MATPNGEKIEPPTVGIAWKNPEGVVSKKEAELPIFVGKFLAPVELDREKFNGFYIEYSLKNKAYFKFDSFIRVSDSSAQETLKKIGSFLTSICNFKCVPHPNITNLELIFGSAVVSLKNSEGVLTNYPILMEVQAYPESNEYVRLSMRGGHGNTILGIYQQILLFF